MLVVYRTPPKRRRRFHLSYPLSSHTVPFILKATMVEKSKQIKGEQQLLCVTQKLSGLLVNDCGIPKAIPAQGCQMTSISTFTEEPPEV